MADKSRSDQNQEFLDTLFLDGGNAAYLEQMQAQYTRDPRSVDASWRAYFADLGEESGDAQHAADGPAWKQKGWPIAENGELTSALTGDWGADPKAAERAVAHANPNLSKDEVQQAAKDSIGALMLIRAYRVRGHCIANLDPLSLSEPGDHPELDPATYGFSESDRNREIFIDGVLGLEYSTVDEIIDLSLIHI